MSTNRANSRRGVPAVPSSAVPLAEFPFAPGPYGQPPAEYARRRADEPLGFVRMPSGDAVALVTRYHDVRVVLTDPRFRSCMHGAEASQPSGPRDTVGVDDWLLNLQPTEHARIRQVIGKAFAPQRLAIWRPRIWKLAETLVDEMARQQAPVDLVVAFAKPLPVRAMSDFLGLPEIDRAESRAWRLPPGSHRLNTYVEEVVQKRRIEPAGGLLSDLIAAADHHGVLSEQELSRCVRMLIRTGVGTIATTIGRGVFALLRHRHHFAALSSDSTLLDAAVEEILRLELPGDGSVIRVATEDVELPSGTIPKGTVVLPIVTSANRDEDRFQSADSFDLNRTDNGHLAFGYGPHYCIGAPLARLELKAAIGVLAARLPTLGLAVDPGSIRWTHGARNAVRELPVCWEAGLK